MSDSCLMHVAFSMLVFQRLNGSFASLSQDVPFGLFVWSWKLASKMRCLIVLSSICFAVFDLLMFTAASRMLAAAIYEGLYRRKGDNRCIKRQFWYARFDT